MSVSVRAPIFDAAIVGMGPSGAVLAALLARQGLSVYVCDRLPGVYEIPRALAMDHEIMRVFQQLGLVDAISPFCEPFTPSEYYGVDGQLIRRMTMVDPPYPMGHVPSLVFSQPPLEKALRQCVAGLSGVTVELQTEMLSLSQTDDMVTITVRSADGHSKPVSARWLIGCDGGASSVRAMAGLTLEDLDFDEPWLVVDVMVNEQGLQKLPKVSVQYCEPERPCTLVIGPGQHRRWEISLKPGEDPQLMATPEQTWRLLSRWITPHDGELWRQSSYRFHALVAHEWRQGRVFLAGDAAHMQPPFLGQGMCQGIRDVVNLAWKLDTVKDRPWHDPLTRRIMDTYGAERRAHVRELTQRIKKIGEVICERDITRARARDAQLLAACGGVVPDTPRQDVLPPLEVGMLSRTPSTARGTLFPQPRLAPDGRLMDEVLGHGWRWVSDGHVNLPQMPALWRSCLLGDTCLELEGVVASWLARHQCHAALVRPDHRVFGVAGDDQQALTLRDEWMEWLGQVH
jgi:3-(3-hydroxy-phenyl)propionate hydroxylase